MIICMWIPCILFVPFSFLAKCIKILLPVTRIIPLLQKIVDPWRDFAVAIVKSQWWFAWNRRGGSIEHHTTPRHVVVHGERVKIKGRNTQPRQGTVVRVTFQSTSTLIRVVRCIREAGGPKRRNRTEGTMRRDYREYNGTRAPVMEKNVNRENCSPPRSPLSLFFSVFFFHICSSFSFPFLLFTCHFLFPICSSFLLFLSFPFFFSLFFPSLFLVFFFLLPSFFW